MVSITPTQRLMNYFRKRWKQQIRLIRADYYKQALALIVDDLPGLFYANENVIYGVNGRVHDFIQRADNTVRFVTTENNVWVTD